ncbi:3'-5' exoribonuclease [Salmonella enterica]|uniref:3'-5' exoribonuclease n=3 Tax=Salmonella enterica TaxID=28901 RepID=A0A765FV60_SALER|nr:3'-5' exoribonuclease [Salmonella enterica]ECC9936349.1 3'-5' exoribonuclease [Salmonella enterica subsp. enterica]ECD7242856.1 3'-5' exoribonuclease [Salmonella enterica subsp. enterica serovar Florida]ECE2928294.1 3'-5' exoribonuclease [Salmonella enterica]ECF4165888.1 3'-5' exoribonuclease [Salmonella enterica subsp. enterica serovar Florida]
MNNVMVDIETTGTAHHSAITSAAASVFNPLTGEICAEKYIKFKWKEDCKICGGKIDADTVEWWMKQSSEARAELITCDRQLSPFDALMRLFDFIRKHCDEIPVYVWAKSPSFDLSLIKDAAERCGIPAEMIPWKFRNERDVRTIEGIGAQLNIPLPYGKKDVTHHALADVRGQISNVATVMSFLSEAVGE